MMPNAEYDKRVLVIGATGMIGANLTERLVAEGFDVTVLARETSNLIRLRALAEQLQVIRGDLLDRASVRHAIRQVEPTIVFHLATSPFTMPTFSAEEHAQVNVQGTMHLLEALRDAPTVRLVYTGSVAEYGGGSQLREESVLQPGTVFGACKAAASLLLAAYARRYRMSIVTLRLTMPYGPWEHPKRLVPHTILSALRGQDVPMTRGEQQRDLVYVGDVVDALLLAATRSLPPGTVFNIGSGVGTPIKDAVMLILGLMGNPVKPLLGALPTRPDEIMEMSVDITAARERLGWAPKTSLEEGFRQSIAWFRGHRDLVRQFAEERLVTHETVVPAVR